MDNEKNKEITQDEINKEAPVSEKENTDSAALDTDKEKESLPKEKETDKVSEKTPDKDSYERVCFSCHRPESRVDKMIQLPNDISVCSDCMQKSFDLINQGNVDISAFLQIPGMEILDFTNPANQTPRRQRVKKKSDKKEPGASPIAFSRIPAPHKIKAMLDEYVVGQTHAKKAVSVAVYNHYKRVSTNTMNDIEIEKSNMLLIGPSGSGKTYLVQTLAKILDVPLAIADATSLTEAGYIGDDIESVVTKLLAAADNDVEKAECGIIFIDEIDKIAKKITTSQRDVSGESVQQGMLKLLEGSKLEVPVGANSKNGMVPLTTVNTRNILFICGGAFPDLSDIIKERLNKTSSMGFNAKLKDAYDNEKNLQTYVKVEDLRKFGMLPEFLGRLPVIVPFETLTEDMLISILKEPKNAILKQYQRLLELDEVELLFTEDALHAIAKKALEQKSGARGLRAVIEEFMLDIMYEIPKDDNIGTVTITADYINGKGAPQIAMRGHHKAVKLIGRRQKFFP